MGQRHGKNPPLPSSSLVSCNSDPLIPMSTEAEKKMVILKSMDGVTLEVEESVVEQFESVKILFEEHLAGAFIPLPNVNSQILARVIDYCKHHANNIDDKEYLRAFDAEFVKVDQATLFDLILVANYLNVKSLLDLTCQTVADMIKGKTPKELGNLFNCQFSSEEEAEIERENAWAFE